MRLPASVSQRPPCRMLRGGLSVLPMSVLPRWVLPMSLLLVSVLSALAFLGGAGGAVGAVRPAFRPPVGSDHVPILGGAPAHRQQYATLASDARRVSTAVWGESGRPEVVVVLAESAGEFRAAIGGGRAGADAAEVAGVAAATMPSSGRIVLNVAETSRLTTTGRQVVLTHEMTHLAAPVPVAGSADPVPMWFSEGLADYIAMTAHAVPLRMATGSPAADVLRPAAVRLDGTVPADTEFGGPDADGAYARAYLACRHLVLRLGLPAVLDLYRAAVQDGFEQTLGSRLGLSSEQLRIRLERGATPTGTSVLDRLGIHAAGGGSL